MNRTIGTKKREKLQQKVSIKPKKLIPIAPTILIGVLVISLTLIPKGHIIKLQLQNDRFVFVTDFQSGVSFSPIKDVPINSIDILNFKSVKIGYKNLYALHPNDSTTLLSRNGTAEFIPQLIDYELNISGRNIKIASLEIGDESLVNMALGKEIGCTKLCLEIHNYPSILRLQFPGDSVIVKTKRCITNYTNYSSNGELIRTRQTTQKRLLFIPSETEAIFPISGTDNVLKLAIEISEDVFKSVFESEISLKMVGFEEAHISPAQERILKAKCKLLQTNASKREAYHDQNVFIKQLDLNKLRLEGIDLFPDPNEPGNINLNFSGYMKKFKVGLHEDRLMNIIPSCLEWLSKSPWAITAAILAWLITSSLLAFDILYRRRGKEEK